MIYFLYVDSNKGETVRNLKVVFENFSLAVIHASEIYEHK